MNSAVWPSPQLKNLEHIGSLVGEATSRDEIQRLLSLAEASLSAAQTRSLAVEPRLAELGADLRQRGGEGARTNGLLHKIETLTRANSSATLAG